MTGEVFGLSGLIILLVFMVLPIWALVDAISQPTGAFAAAGSSKGMWIALIVVFSTPDRNRRCRALYRLLGLDTTPGESHHNLILALSIRCSGILFPTPCA